MGALISIKFFYQGSPAAAHAAKWKDVYLEQGIFFSRICIIDFLKCTHTQHVLIFVSSMDSSILETDRYSLF
jgi:hypothetical protein